MNKKIKKGQTAQWLRYYLEEAELQQLVGTGYRYGKRITNAQRERYENRLEFIRSRMHEIGATFTQEQFEEYIEDTVMYTWEEHLEDYGQARN